MNASMELFSKLNDYLERRITLWDLESWLAPRLPIFLDAPDSVVGRMAGAIELCIAELQDGLKSERTVKQVLKRYQEVQRTVWISPESSPQSNITTSATSTIPVGGLLSQLQVWNNELQEANA